MGCVHQQGGVLGAVSESCLPAAILKGKVLALWDCDEEYMN